ncbi:MAG: homoserine kinase [Verrucomicrobiales bacterium]|jgi:homoserine kinase|nr:homoserine kinase [Verrucomicrobiales bacterium]
MNPASISVRVPATAANFGPGFDCLGVALNLYNTVTVSAADTPWPDDFIAAAADNFFTASGRPPRPFAVTVSGDVPRSRGLGSSVTVRLGLVAALNAFFDSPLSREDVLDVVVELEGHPDNAVPGCYGGFAVSGKAARFTVAVEPVVRFVAVIPDHEVETAAARRALPAQIPLPLAVENIQNTSLIVSAFLTGKYSLLKGAFADHLHQPYRAGFIPGCADAIRHAEQAGALGAFISGSGSTLMAVTLDRPELVAESMKLALTEAGGGPAHSLILSADNEGARVI